MTDQSTPEIPESHNSGLEPSRRWRRPLAGSLAVVAALSLVFAVTATWMNTTLLDTDEWVESVAPLPDDAEFQQIIAERVADEVLTLIDLPALMENALGPAGKFLAAPAADASKGFIEDASVKVLASPEFETIWIEANRIAHQTAVKVLRGEVDAANVVDGQVTLDLVPLINNVVALISQDIPDLFGGVVAIPEVTADQVDQATTNLADAMGITIPSDFGQVPVFDTEALTAAQDGVRWLDDGMVALWVLFGLALVGSIVASVDRRRTIAFVGVVTAVTAVTVWVLRWPLETDIVDEIKNPSGKKASQIVIEVALWSNLGPLIAALVIVSLLAATISWLAGPSRSAVTVRRTVTGLFGDHHPQTTASIFMRSHTTAFRIAGAVAALAALLSIPRLTWGWFLTIVVVLVAYEMSWIYVAPIDDNDPKSEPVPAPG
ncbi:MAG: hypothetical protein OEU32_02440 [Acidimicrobiia bacterium]|nr:hypothetical protein [Acidimicrobiia bacterium]